MADELTFCTNAMGKVPAIAELQARQEQEPANA